MPWPSDPPRADELVYLVEACEVMQRLGSGSAAGQGVTAGEFDRFGNVAERNEPVSFTRHKLVACNS